MKNYRSRFLGLLASAAFCFAGRVLADGDAKFPEVGDVPPPFRLSKVVQGAPINEISWEKLKGKVVVVEFWNTACGPCVQSIPHLNELVKAFRDRPVVFISLSDDNEDHLKYFLKKHPIESWIVLDAPFSATKESYGVDGIPDTVIVDASGKIVVITHPQLLEAKHIEAVLAGRPSGLPTKTRAESSRPARKKPEADSLAEPTTIDVKVSGPFPQPNGAFNFRNWKGPGNCIFEAKKAFLKDALAVFFDIDRQMVSGDAADSEKLYDIYAAAPQNKRAELRVALVEKLRKELNVIAETNKKQVEVYALTVCATNVSGLKKVDKGGGGGDRAGGFYLGGAPFKSIAEFFGHHLGKPVVDETGLSGKWSVDLNWHMTEAEEKDDAEPNPAEIIRAVREQLGLELKLVKRDLPTLSLRFEK